MAISRKLCRLLVITTLTGMVFSLCPYECMCRDEPTHCPVAVSLVTDGCNCCKVCAKQTGEECNDQEKVCDPHRDLFCDYSGSRSGDWGVCRARSGRPCMNNGVRLSSGAMYEPSCKFRCWCMDGNEGCQPLCPHETHIPKFDICPNARLQPVSGECCDRWMCDSSSGEEFMLPMERFWTDFVEEKSEVPAPSVPETGNGVMDGIIYEDDVGETIDELMDEQFPQSMVYEPAIEPEANWIDNNAIPGDVDAARREQRSRTRGHSSCDVHTSAWSPCSKSCGLGVSVRVSNDNPRCQLGRDMRLCQLRPCQGNRYGPKKGRHCMRQKRARKRETLTYAGCTSVRKSRPRYCGGCHGPSRCCTPKSTRTISVQFQCTDGSLFSKKMMVIRSCSCHSNCSPNVVHREVFQYALHNDMHQATAR